MLRVIDAIRGEYNKAASVTESKAVFRGLKAELSVRISLSDLLSPDTRRFPASATVHFPHPRSGFKSHHKMREGPCIDPPRQGIRRTARHPLPGESPGEVPSVWQPPAVRAHP